MPELRWPNFSDYTSHVQKFYDLYGYSLPWVRDMQPTPQAQQIIAVLLNAEQKGLSADDYDGSGCAGEIASRRMQARGDATIRGRCDRV